ncbi:hypothetical protein VTN77DRAFT_1203 [Rasamsonia byssochlamydoides]|uniref:uncharacterized protein n=1 Tax=Rasamsonia byssochlamydoides TaxID=89139 RepID=UPI0037420692
MAQERALHDSNGAGSRRLGKSELPLALLPSHVIAVILMSKSLKLREEDVPLLSLLGDATLIQKDDGQTSRDWLGYLQIKDQSNYYWIFESSQKVWPHLTNISTYSVSGSVDYAGWP